jgi:hypothetical protein
MSPGQNAGDLHFDADENWTLKSYAGVNLLQTAVHELGHSLGLDHSRVRGSIMFPSYGGYQPNLKLHTDDIRGVQALYGPPTTTELGDKELDEEEQQIWRICPVCEIM